MRKIQFLNNFTENKDQEWTKQKKKRLIVVPKLNDSRKKENVSEQKGFVFESFKKKKMKLKLDQKPT